MSLYKLGSHAIGYLQIFTEYAQEQFMKLELKLNFEGDIEIKSGR